MCNWVCKYNIYNMEKQGWFRERQSSLFRMCWGYKLRNYADKFRCGHQIFFFLNPKIQVRKINKLPQINHAEGKRKKKNEPSFLPEQRVTHWKITVVGWLWSWIPLSEALKCYHYPNINELPSSSNISSLRTTVLVLQWDISAETKNTLKHENHLSRDDSFSGLQCLQGTHYQLESSFLLDETLKSQSEWNGMIQAI